MFEETPSFLNVVTIRIPGRKEDGQAVQLTIRNDTTAEQLLATVSEVCKNNLPHQISLNNITYICTEIQIECSQSFREIKAYHEGRIYMYVGVSWKCHCTIHSHCFAGFIPSSNDVIMEQVNNY